MGEEKLSAPVQSNILWEMRAKKTSHFLSLMARSAPLRIRCLNRKYDNGEYSVDEMKKSVKVFVKMSAANTWLQSLVSDEGIAKSVAHSLIHIHVRIVFTNAPNSLKFWRRYHYTVKVFITSSWRHQLCAIQIGSERRGKTCTKKNAILLHL